MKKLFKLLACSALIASICLPLGGCTTNQDMMDSRRDLVGKIQKTVDMPNVSKSEICKKSRDWMANTFIDSKAVIEVFDIEEGTIIGKASTNISAKSGFVKIDFPIRFTMKIDCRDGRYRFAASNPVLNWRPFSNDSGSVNGVDLAKSDDAAPAYLKLIDDLNASLLISIQQKSDF